MHLWTSIAEILESNNFKLGCNGGERCRQKFANLTKAYQKYIKNQKTTGAAFMEQPPFFDEIHLILGEYLSLRVLTFSHVFFSFD